MIERTPVYRPAWDEELFRWELDAKTHPDPKEREEARIRAAYRRIHMAELARHRYLRKPAP